MVLTEENITIKKINRMLEAKDEKEKEKEKENVNKKGVMDVTRKNGDQIVNKCFRKKSREAVRKRNYFKQTAINDFLYVSISVAGDLNHWGWGGGGRGLSKMFQ